LPLSRYRTYIYRDSAVPKEEPTKRMELIPLGRKTISLKGILHRC